MKILILFDVARYVPPTEAYTAEMFLQEEKVAEADILRCLQRLGHTVESMAVFDNVTDIIDKVKAFAPDIVFNQCESFYDNRALEPNIPALLELMKIPYTGSGPEPLLLCKDKTLAKKILAHHRVRVPRFVVSHVKSPLRRLQRFGYPAFVKPIGQESSDGISKASFVKNEKEALERLRFLHQRFAADAMIEEYIDGRELYISVLGNRRRVVFPPREIFFERMPDDEPHFATSHAKWNDAYREKWGITNGPARELPEAVHAELRKVARNVYGWLAVRGFGRIDIRLSPSNEMHIIEVNPNPSLAMEDDFAQSANDAGMSYDELIQEILNAALN